MLSFVMMKGHGKTVFGLNAASYLTNIGTCVVNFALDMGEITMMDRTLSRRDGFKAHDLVNYKLQGDDEVKLRRSIFELSEIKNYLHISENNISLDKFDTMCYQIKEKFKNLGVLPDDGYFIVIFDTLDLIEDFSRSETAYNIKTNINKLHDILRRHQIFAINLLQANENKIRTRNFQDPDSAERFRIGLMDIEGGASYASRSRVVLAGNRPLQMKKMIFHNHEDSEIWDTEEDIYYVSIVKQNDGPLGHIKYVLDKNTYRMYVYGD
jgi:replicative DNA helicase